MMADVVTVIGGGWSVRNVDLERLPGVIIAVNDSAIHAPVWDLAVSMDRLWAENRLEAIGERIAQGGRPRALYLRESAVQNLEHRAAARWIRVFRCDHESTTFTVDPEALNGTNSGMCALNLAWQLNPRRLYLLGFDMCRDSKGQAYWYAPYPWAAPVGSTTDGKYGRWSDQFRNAARAFTMIGCQVSNVSPCSKISAFPKLTASQFLKETK
jgi:hypothetical protein